MYSNVKMYSFSYFYLDLFYKKDLSELGLIVFNNVFLCVVLIFFSLYSRNTCKIWFYIIEIFIFLTNVS